MSEFNRQNMPPAIAELPDYVRRLGINTLYLSYNNERSFDALDDTWQIGTREFIYLGWMKELIPSVSHYLAIRLALAKQVEWHPWSTMVNRSRALKNIAPVLHDSFAFQRCFNAENRSRRKQIIDFFKKMQNDYSEVGEWIKAFFVDIWEFLEEQDYPQPYQRKIWDPTKGAYNEQEELDIAEKTRLAYLRIHSDTKGYLELESFRKPEKEKLCRLSAMIAATLNAVLVRRGCQLNQMKWSDLLPIQVSFNSHHHNLASEIPQQDCTFSDMEHLKIRIFRGKSGTFRQDVELVPHIIEPAVSQWVLYYRQLFRHCLNRSLLNQGINLRSNEMDEIMWRCPVFSEQRLFKMNFGNKKTLFSAIGHQSDSFHLTSSWLSTNIKRYSNSLCLKSDRNSELCLSNNRHRHTVGTKLARQGKDKVQISKVLGNTPQAASCYIELDLESRGDIDEVMAGVKLFTQYSTKSVAELKNKYSQALVNEFDQEQGLILNRKNCHTCGVKLGKPLGCYGCANFRPHIEGDHRGNLLKAQSQLEVNSAGAARETIRRIELCVLWIRATIWACDEMKLVQQGISYGRS